MPEISIILPTVRPDQAAKRIKEFALTNPDIDYEILVTSRSPISGEKVVHIEEKEMRGSVQANIIAYERSRGDYIVYWADDASPGRDCLKNMLAFVRKQKEPFIGSFRFKTRRGLMAEQYQAYGKLYACFGLLSRETIKTIGGFFDPLFHCHCPDVDIGLRVWDKGGKVAVCPTAWVLFDSFKDDVNSGNLDNYWITDTEAFLKRWHHKFGGGYPRDITKVLGPVRLSAPIRFSFFIYSRLIPRSLKRLLKIGDEKKVESLFGRHSNYS